MNSEKKTDVFELIQQFQNEIKVGKPTISEMAREVRMMKYKIRPVLGDVSVLDFNNPEFIEALWNLGKLDEFLQKSNGLINEEELEVFIRLMDEMRSEFQEDLNKANLKPLSQLRAQHANFELEIFKERSKQMN